jgi:hypothetical protein
MIAALDNHLRTGFQDLLTGGESWMTRDENPIRMCAFDRTCVDEAIHLIAYYQKTMITVFCGGDGIALLEVLPSGAGMISEHFGHNIREEFDDVVYPNG